MSQLYNDRLLALAKAPEHRVLPADPTVRARRSNPMCGDEVELAAIVASGRLETIGFDASACAICEASASLLCAQLRGRPLHALGEATAALEALLGGQTPTADDPFAPFASVAAFPSRHGCALLPWVALADALATETAAEAEPTPPRPAPATLDSVDAWAAIAALRAGGEAVALATLVAIEGAGPAPLGSQMVIGASGRSWGAVSGGCVEPAVLQAAARLLAARDPRACALLDYTITNGQASAVGLTCGGSILVYLRRAPAPAIVERLAAVAHHDGAPLLQLIPLDGGPLRLVDADALDTLPAAQAALARAALVHGPQLSEASPAGLFIAASRPRPRLILIGATHIAAKLAQLARIVDLAPIIVDPRVQLAAPERFPGAEVRCEQPRRVLPKLIDASSSVVALTHDAKLDDPALEIALRSEAVYVAALGSRKTQRARLERLRARGLPEEALARLHGPAGLSIGAKGAGEIAASILAELIATRRGAP